MPGIMASAEAAGVRKRSLRVPRESARGNSSLPAVLDHAASLPKGGGGLGPAQGRGTICRHGQIKVLDARQILHDVSPSSSHMSMLWANLVRFIKI